MKPFKCTELIDARTSIKKSVTDASPQIINKVDHVTSKLREDEFNESDLSKLSKFKCDLCIEIFSSEFNLMQKENKISVRIRSG